MVHTPKTVDIFMWLMISPLASLRQPLAAAIKAESGRARNALVGPICLSHDLGELGLDRRVQVHLRESVRGLIIQCTNAHVYIPVQAGIWRVALASEVYPAALHVGHDVAPAKCHPFAARSARGDSRNLARQGPSPGYMANVQLLAQGRFRNS